MEPHGLKHPLALNLKFGRIEGRDQWHADDAAILQATLGQELEIMEHRSNGMKGVALVDVGMHVLHVDDPLVDDRDETLDVMLGHSNTCLDGEAPLKAVWMAHRQLLEVGNELATQAWLPATEGHSASGGKEIKVIHLHLLHQLLGSVRMHACLIFTLWIEAILASERTVAERDECGHTLAIDGNAMATDGKDRSRHTIQGEK